MSRLHVIAPDLADAIAEASAPRQLQLTAVACRFAVTAAAVDQRVALSALAALEAGGRPSDDELVALRGLRDTLDDEYFDLQERGDSRELAVFSQARAVAAIDAAFAANSSSDCSEAVYEASNAVDDAAVLFTRVRAELRL